MDNNNELKKNTILVADDEEGMRRILRFRLTKAGYEVTCVENGKKALEFLEKERPDLIISDISMPEMNGYELYKEVSSRKEYRFIPFLFLSSKSERQDIIFAKKMGVDDYLTKPVDKDLLLISVEAKLARFAELKEEHTKLIEQKINAMYRVLTHEINTPISIINGFTELSEMLLSAGKVRIEELKTFMEGIKSGNDRLKKLAEKVLILNSIDGGYEERRYISLKENRFIELTDLIRSISYNFKDMIDEKKVDVILNLPEEGLMVKAVDSHVTCIMENLIDNAIKFVRRNTGKVEVNAYKKGETVKVEVKDNGIGIPEEEREKIFDRYYQYNREKTEQQGLGIGLSLVRSLAQINNLDLELKTEVTKGTTFTIIFKDIDNLYENTD